MGLLIFTYRKHDLARRKYEIEFKLTQLSQKLQDLHSYSASISDGSVSLNDLMNAPASVFNRMSMYMMYSHQGAMAGANEKFNFMRMTPGAIPPMQSPQMQQQYNDMLFKNLYEQERERFKKVEEKALNAQDMKIAGESNKLQTELKMIEAELTEVKSAEDKAAKDSAPKYSAQG